MKCSVCENEMVCPLCVDTGNQRYWEGRWRDERALNEELIEIMEEAIAYGDWPLWAEKARAAIAKATGELPPVLLRTAADDHD